MLLLLLSQSGDADAGGAGPINLAAGGRETPWTAMLALEVRLKDDLQCNICLAFYALCVKLYM